MAAPGGGGGGRRASTSRAPRRAAPEPNENDDLAAAPSPSSSPSATAAATFGPAPPFSQLPRSPLAAIADPGRYPRSAPGTPKSLAGTPRACAAASGARDRSSSIGGAARRVFDPRDLAAAEVPVEVPHFELDEDPTFWMDRNVQVLVRMRPISAAESTAHGQRRCLIQDSSKTLSWIGHPETMFTFDHVACETISQEKLFRVVGLPMVENCMSGYNGCLFAYGQTGSGKTYTMMGELSKEGHGLNDDSGLTPRIFQYLFARIKEDEERRRDDRLKYTCKCSFLEIYNEQITDLLEPSSTNLQIREDIKKGVYVDNLTECHVSSVKDVMLLLLQGVANRKMAATNMNSESSRSHSVFTCVIESHWERDSMTHLRFGRLNLVDLAGSERQKSSGAEGERLKEAANINRSLSTLGLVIMTLVDGKSRHVPYRDSRLTFLLQDSLGGNSKTTIVANISPSICSSNETLSTLKFAQRAKLIQNNAKVNEDASGDVMALQRQIEKLKDQLTCLRKQQSVPGSPSFHLPNSRADNEHNNLAEDHEASCDLNLLKQKVSHLEDVLIGSLRREKLAEVDIRKMEAEIKHLNRLVDLKEYESQRLRTTLKLRDEKLIRLHLLADDLVPSDGYLVDENAAMLQEIQLLQKQINENPQLTQFAFENKKLIEQVRTLQNFHKQGEREMLLTEISLLRNHFLHILEQKYATPSKNIEAEGDEIIKDLDNCRKELDACLENNVLLAREVNKLRCELKQYQKSSAHQVALEAETNCEIPETSQMQHDPVGWNFSSLASNDAEIATNSKESVQLKIPSEIASEDQESHSSLYPFDLERCGLNDSAQVPECIDELSQCYSLALGSSHNIFDKGIILSTDTCLHSKTSLCHQETEIPSSSKQALQGELVHVKSTNQELRKKLVTMAEESARLAEIIVAKDIEIASLSEEWEGAIVDLTSFLTDGCRSLEDAYQNIDNMISSVPYSNNTVSEHVEKAMKVSIEKEKIIFRLQIELQAAHRMGREVKEKLHILRGATLAISEAQQLYEDESSLEAQRRETKRQQDCSVEQQNCLFAEAVERKNDMSAQQTHNEDGSAVREANPDYQSKLDDVLHLVEDKSNKVLALFSNFEEAQETMKEADLMLSALLKANEELKLEKDSCSEAVELLLAEKTSLIDELQQLEASSSCTAQRNNKLHQQMNECIKEMTNTATVMKGSFHQIQRVTTVELYGLCSEIINFGQELKRWISDSRSYLVNRVSALEEKATSAAQQVHLLDANAYTCMCQRVGSRSCEVDDINAAFLHETQAIPENSREHIISLTDMTQEGFKNVPSLSSNIHDISSIEKKAVEHHQICLQNGNTQAGYSTDYASLRRDFDRKSHIAEGLSFDLKLLQESTSYAKDMKDRADEVSSALKKVQRELEIKTSEAEEMLVKQKALVEELAENGAALIILRSELEQSQDSSSVLWNENNDLRVMLEEETGKTSEIKALLEDKAKVLEGLESEILLLNSSEEGQLRSDVEKLSNNVEVLCNQNGKLKAEILKLHDKLEMAMALAEENEAAAVEARQTAEISKIHAEEKDEEVTILEHSVEELESTITVLEKEVCNLKEEVKSYQAHKLSEAEFQAIEEMLTVENALKCDGNAELCPGRCQLEKKLRAEIIAHQDARRKIKRKDDEIRQYKEHIAELVLHSEAQSLLFQEKYREMEHMVSEQKFVAHESSSETVHAKVEKPSGRIRSGSPFRCISSLVQQMNSEKDQEISLARQRIEELEALLSNKQKEICLLTSRLAAVDSMTHDVIRELLSVKLDMTKYANLLDQEDVHKLLVASQQEIEQSKAKDAELDVLKEQFGHLIQERDSLLDDMDQRKADLLETQLLVEQLEQREQMLEAQNEMLQMEKDNLQQKIMEMDETIELLEGSNQVRAETTLRMGDNQRSASSDFSRRLAQSDMLLSQSHARQERSRTHAAAGSSRTRHGRYQ